MLDTKLSDSNLSKKERAKKCVLDFLDSSEKYAKPYFEEFAKIHSDYVLSRSNKKLFQRADLKPPYTFTIIESFTPEVVEAFFSDKPYINAYSRHPAFYPFEKQIEEYTSYCFDEMNIIPKFAVFVKNTLLFGTSVVKTLWRKESKNVKGPYGVESQKVFDGPDWDNIPFSDFFPDASNRHPGNIDVMRGCIHRIWRSWGELKRNQKRTLKDGSQVGVYENLSELKAFLDTEDENNKKLGGNNGESNYQDRYTDRDSNLRNINKLEVLEYWGEFDPTGEGIMYEYVITLVERKYVIRCEINPLEGLYKPFLASVDYPVPNEFYGMGEIKPSWSLIREASTLRNSRLDALNLTLNPMMVVDRGAGFNLRNMYTRPGGVLLSNDINGIKEFGLADRALNALSSIADLDEGITKAVGLTPSGISGNVNSNFARTSSGVNYLNRTLSSRILLKVRLLANMVLNPYAQRMLIQTRQFSSSDILFRLIGDGKNPFQELSLEALQHNYAFCINSAMDRMTKKDRQANLKENVIPLLQLFQQASPGKFNWDEFIPDTLRDFDYRQVDKYLVPDEVVQQRKEQEMQMQMQMAEHNAHTQADAQTKVVATKETINAETKANSDQMNMFRDIIKGVISNEQQETAQDNQLSGNLATTMLKELAADARNESSIRSKPKSGAE